MCEAIKVKPPTSSPWTVRMDGSLEYLRIPSRESSVFSIQAPGKNDSDHSVAAYKMKRTVV